jgi:hypothetical protein
VLRDKAAPSFREVNSAARLSQIFAEFASRGVDLSMVSVITPQLSEAPTFDPAADVFPFGWLKSRKLEPN